MDVYHHRSNILTASIIAAYVCDRNQYLSVLSFPSESLPRVKNKVTDSGGQPQDPEIIEITRNKNVYPYLH